MFEARTAPPRRRSVWIVVIVAAVMVVPSSALLSSHGTPASSARVGGAVTPSAPLTPTAIDARAAALTHLGAGSRSPGFGDLPPAAGLPSQARPSSPHLTSVAAPLAPSGPSAAVITGATALVAAHAVPERGYYPPNLHLLSSRATSPAQAVSPTYQLAPAPMGLGDFGLGPSGTNYSVYTPDVRGTVQLNGYNATAGPLYQDTGAYYWDGYSPNSSVPPWQSGLQLNTVVTNVSYPGANNGSFWTQNVVSFVGNTMQLIDNVWNFSNPSAALENGTLYSYDGVPVYPQFYFAIGPTLPVAFPLTLQLFNNASNVLGRTTVTFGYRIVEPSGTFTGTYDTVVFNSRPSVSVPLLTPNYLISGSTLNPVGLLYDSELVFGGPGGGSNSVINELNGTLNLSYRLAGHWKPASSTYDYGADTGETSIGVAGWFRGATEFVNQGPSMLYGLWNATGGVTTGNIAVNFTTVPDYAFVFIARPGTAPGNASYAPSNALGTARTWLPPGPIYSLEAYADGFNPSGLLFSGSVNVAAFSLSPNAAVWNAPIYLNGPAQAERFGNATHTLTGTTLSLHDRAVGVGQQFNHLNDFGLPEFALLWALDLGPVVLNVTNLSQGPDRGGATIYYTDSPGSMVDAPGLGGAIEVWASANASFEDLNLVGYDFGAGFPSGGAVSLWHVPDAFASAINSTNSSFGVWSAASPNTSVVESNASNGAVVFSPMDGATPYGFGLNATSGGADVLAEGGVGGTFVDLNATNGSAGYAGLGENSSVVVNVLATDNSTGVVLSNDSFVRVDNVSATTSSVGIAGDGANRATLSLLSSVGRASDPLPTYGAVLFGSNGTIVENVSANDSAGAVFSQNGSYLVENISAVNNSLGVLLNGTGLVTVLNVSANFSLGVGVENSTVPIVVKYVTASAGSVGVETFNASRVDVSHVTSVGGGFPPAIGVWFVLSDRNRASQVSASGAAIGVNITASNATVLHGITASSGAAGAFVGGAVGVTATSFTATQGAVGFLAINSSNLHLRGFNASLGGFGAVVQQSNRTWASGFSATAQGLGFLGFASHLTSVNGTTADNVSVGAVMEFGGVAWINRTTATGASVAVALLGAYQVAVLGVRATEPSSGSPWANFAVWGLPTAGVVSARTNESTVTDLVATRYPVGLFDANSSNLVVNQLNASFGGVAVMLNGSFATLLQGVQAYSDRLGVQINQDGRANVVTLGSFVSNSGYGVDIENGTANTVYDNSFVANNGAGAVYNASHLQAFSSSPTNAFNSSARVGNYWADWHTYANGVLAPYYVGSAAWDLHPLGAPEGTYAVTFTAVGLAPGASWSVTLNGVAQSTIGSSVTFDEAPGSYGFSVAGPSGWTVAPAGGTVLVSTGAVALNLSFSRTFSVDFAASGLTGGANWTVYLNGVAASSTNGTIDFTVPSGSYAYTVVAPSGWEASPSSGTVSVSGNYTVPVVFGSTAVPRTTVTVHEQGIKANTLWTVVFGGVARSSSNATLVFTVPSGSYAFQVEPLANYTASPASGAVTVSGATYLLWVAFTVVTYPVTFAATGLAAGTVWTVTVDGVPHTTSLGAITLELPNGSASYAFSDVSGYSVANATGSVTVDGAPASASAPYAPTSTPSYVASSTFNQDWAIALGVAAFAVLLALVALLRRPRAPRPPPRPADVPAAPAPAPAPSGTTPSEPAHAPWSES